MERISRPAVLLFLLATFVIGKIGFSYGEIFPFAPWDMFSRTPSNLETFRIRVHRIGDQTFDPPRYLLDFPEYERRMRHPVNLVVIRRFGHAWVEGDPAADRYRRLTEDTFELHDATYELVRVAYDPLIRYRTGDVAETPEAIFEGRARHP
jgi:hypothetical protein